MTDQPEADPASLRTYSRRELLDELAERGVPVNDRRLSSLITDGLVRPARRNGQRAGQFPALTVDLVECLVTLREWGYKVSTLRELLPLWRLLQAQMSQFVLDLDVIEAEIETSVSTLPAATAIAMLVSVTAGVTTRGGDSPLVLRRQQRPVPKGNHGALTFAVRLVDPVAQVTRDIQSVRLVLPPHHPGSAHSTITASVGTSAAPSVTLVGSTIAPRRHRVPSRRPV